MNSIENGFTPVRRRQQQYSNSVEQDTTDPRFWTAARCQRLLRSLQSRLELLRKERANIRSAPATSIRTKDNNVSLGNEDVDKTKIKEADHTIPELGHVRKKIRTYAGRGAKSKSKNRDARGKTEVTESQEKGIRSQKICVGPGEISIPTPIFDRTKIVGLAQNSFQALGCDDPLKKTRRKYPFYASQDIRIVGRDSTTDERNGLYRGMRVALETLLRVTAPSETQQSKKSSLYFSCLRCIPRQIKQDELWEAVYAEQNGIKSAIEERDVSGELYMELESLSTSEKGWRHLQIVVRAHGVQIICDAISEGLIETQFLDDIMSVCIRTDAIPEAEQLLNSFLERSSYPAPHTSQSKFSMNKLFDPILRLINFVAYTGRMPFCLRAFKKLFATHQLPISWLATKELNPLWTGVFQNIAQNTNETDSRAFLEKVLPLICHYEQETCESAGSSSSTSITTILDSTFISALAALCSISILDERKAAERPEEDCSSRSPRVTISHVLESVALDCQIFSSHVPRKRSVLLAIVMLLTGADRNSDDVPEVLRLLKENCSMEQHSEDSSKENVARLVCAVAYYCGRGTSLDAFEYLKVVIDRLQVKTQVDAIEGAGIVRGLIVDSAYMFAQQVPGDAHLRYAKELETKYSGRYVKPRWSPNEVDAHLHQRYRWEEGISEWVTTTPALTLSVTSYIEHPMFEDESEGEDTPYKPRLKRRKGSSLSAGEQIQSQTSFSHARVSDLVPSSPDFLDSSQRKQTDKISMASKLGVLHNLYSGDNVDDTTKKKLIRLPHARKSMEQYNHSLADFDESDDELILLKTPLLKRAMHAKEGLEGKDNPRRMPLANIENQVSYRHETCFQGDSEDELGF